MSLSTLAAAVLALAAAATDVIAPQPSLAPSLVLTPTCTGAAGEILVCGRRQSDRYRIAPSLRAATASVADQRRAALDPRLECRNVGPRGCGTELVPILTVSGDGSVALGTKR